MLVTIPERDLEGLLHAAAACRGDFIFRERACGAQ
jgi:hypothetical protein